MTSEIIKILPSHPSSDGDGVKIRRVAAFNETSTDPFLMIDELRSDNPEDYIGGFPPHPHRGMETLTYLIQGALEHRDNMGNKGLIQSGGAQWMSAGRGVIHSEMPSREQDGLHGFQLWINLPAAEKMKAPDYRDVPKEEIPTLSVSEGIEAKLIAGKWAFSTNSSDDGASPILAEGPLTKMAANACIADISLEAGTSLTIDVEEGYKAMAFIIEGSLTGISAPKSLVAFDTKDGEVNLSADQTCRVLFLKGKPLKEPVVHYGPFVMSSVEQIEQALQDYRNGTFANG